MERFILLDRDGVLNRRIPGGYVTAWGQFHFLPGALEGLALLARNGVSAIVVSNQAGVGKGLLSPATLQEITRHFLRQVAEHGGHICKVYYCTHRPDDACECRKPKPGLLLQAQREHRFSLSETYFIGDSATDLEAAQSAGSPSLLIADGESLPADTGHLLPYGIFPSLLEAARFVIAHPIRGEPARRR